MGQAVVEPPDPLNNPSPAPTGSADDLLSQLAGDEIDRLLAESEGQKPVKEPAASSTAPVESVGFNNEQSAAEIDALLAGAEMTAIPPEAEAAAEALAQVETSAAAEVAKEIEQNEAERKALRGPDVKAEPAQILIPGATAPLPLFFRPLEWLSSPLDSCPDLVREAVGKIAIVTMVNAIAVLGYVLIFRHHHH